MPIAKLSSGINLYYESYGRGEAIVFIPGTGFAGNVWIESQAEELARSHQVIVHDREDADGQLMQRVFIRSTLWAMTSSPCSNTSVCHMRM
jgi:hypothetical protein